MLRQATAMLIPFPATIAAKVGHGTLPFAFDKVRSLAGPTVSVLIIVGGLVGGIVTVYSREVCRGCVI